MKASLGYRGGKEVLQKDSQEVALKFSFRQSSPVESHTRGPSHPPCNLSSNLRPEAGSSVERVA